jgi:rhodanese-related sulfurtransferase
MAHHDGDRIVSRMTIDELLARARGRLDRVNIAEALDAVAIGRSGRHPSGSPARTRRTHPGAIVSPSQCPRMALRCLDDPGLRDGLGRRIILVRSEGYQSSLAAVTLLDLGFARATDLVGGFRAWAAAGLPVARDVRTGRDSSGNGAPATG